MRGRHAVTCFGTEEGWFVECAVGDLLAYAVDEDQADTVAIDHLTATTPAEQS